MGRGEPSLRDSGDIEIEIPALKRWATQETSATRTRVETQIVIL